MADKYIVTKEELTSLANSIREKTGSANKLSFPTGMISAISEITGGGGGETLLKPSDYPDYVRKEAARVAELARTKIKDNSLVSICMSDSHHNPDDTNNHAGAMHALMAIKSLVYLLPVDFIAHLGDVSFEGRTSGSNPVQDTTTLETNLGTTLPLIEETRQGAIPLFAAIGNHDAGVYVTPGEKADLLSSTYMLNNFTKLAGSEEEGVVYGGLNDGGGGYCYRDFTKQKIRVFLLNTSENIVSNGADGIMLPTQQQWIAQQLIKLNQDKGAEASNWGFVVLCHYPLDYGGTKPVSNIFKAYVAGESISVNGTTYSFAGKNQAKFIVQFHGHIHNFLVDQLYFGEVQRQVNGTPQTQANQYEAYRMAIPNAQYNRENYYYGDVVKDGNGNPIEWSTDGLMWGIKLIQGERYYSSKTVDAQGNEPTLTDERINFTKVPGTEEDVSFVVNVINPDEEMIYSFTYGAGPEVREVGYNFETDKFSINFKTDESKSVSSSILSTITYHNREYRTTLTPIKGRKLVRDSITIKMKEQGVERDITDEEGVLKLAADGSKGEIFISKVTGDIEIEASTNVVAFYNVEYRLVNIPEGSGAVKEIPNVGTPTYNVTFRPVSEDLLINPYLTSITMGGKVVPVELIDNAYTVNIAKVTGDIVIKIEAYKSNLWKFAESTEDNTVFNNGLGYRNNYRLGYDSDGVAENDVPEVGFVVTGCIPYKVDTYGKEGDKKMPETIEIIGATLLNDDSRYKAFIMSNSKGYYSNQIDSSGSVKFSDAFTITQIAEQHYKLVPITTTNSWTALNGKIVGYIRLSLQGSGENLVIHAGAATEDPVTLYSISPFINGLNLTNTSLTIKKDERYYTKLEDTLQYVLKGAPVITMGGTDITLTAWNAATREITIEKVTGNIRIEAESEKVAGSDNLVLVSTEADGTTTYNGTGYKNGWRLDSNGVETAQSGRVVTGFIPYNFDNTICLSGDGINYRTSGYRIYFYREDNGKPGTLINLIDMYPGTNPSNGSTSEKQYGVSYNSNGDILEVTPTDVGDRDLAKYIRLSVGGSGDNPGKNIVVTMKA